MPVVPLIVLIFLLAIFVGFVIVGGWLVMTIFRFLGRILFGPNPNRVIPRHELESRRNGGQCNRPQCRAVNRPYARFCRQCGEPLVAGQHGFPRRVA